MAGRGFWIFQMDVSDAGAYAAYQQAAGPVLAKYNARFMVRGGRSELIEGGGPRRAVILAFPDYDTALACWHSPEYAAAKAHRVGCAMGTVSIVEEYDGPQHERAEAAIPPGA